MFSTAKEIIANGDLGEITSFRGIHAEDYMSDPRVHTHGDMSLLGVVFWLI